MVVVVWLEEEEEARLWRGGCTARRTGRGRLTPKLAGWQLEEPISQPQRHVVEAGRRCRLDPILAESRSRLPSVRPPSEKEKKN